MSGRAATLRAFGHWINPKTESEHKHSYKAILDAGEKLTHQISGRTWNLFEHDAHTLFRIILTRGHSILRLSDNSAITNGLDNRDYDISIDPLSIETLVRAQFEAMCVLHHIYVKPPTFAERELWYLLWVVAGFGKRQQMASAITIQSLIEKAEQEKERMESLIRSIRANQHYQKLAHGDKVVVDRAIKDKNYLVIKKDHRLLKAEWFDVFRQAVPTKSFDHYYTNLSQASHPSNISVFQFREMCQASNSRQVVTFALQTSGMLIAFAIRDYVKIFKSAEIAANGLPDAHQLLLNQLNVMFRGKRFKMNDILRDYDMDTVDIPGYVHIKRAEPR